MYENCSLRDLWYVCFLFTTGYCLFAIQTTVVLPVLYMYVCFLFTTGYCLFAIQTTVVLPATVHVCCFG